MKPPFMKNRKKLCGRESKNHRFTKGKHLHVGWQKNSQDNFVYQNTASQNFRPFIFFILEYWLYIDIGAKSC